MDEDQKALLSLLTKTMDKSDLKNLISFLKSINNMLIGQGLKGFIITDKEEKHFLGMTIFDFSEDKKRFLMDPNETISLPFDKAIKKLMNILKEQNKVNEVN
jgi:hypothetical protein